MAEKITAYGTLKIWDRHATEDGPQVLTFLDREVMKEAVQALGAAGFDVYYRSFGFEVCDSPDQALRAVNLGIEDGTRIR